VSSFRLGFVTGATPDKWAGTWRQRERDPIEVVPMVEVVQEHGLRGGALDMALVRLPVDRDGLHLIPLYEELQVAVLNVENELTLLDELTLDDLADQQLVLPHRSGWRPGADQLDWPPMTEREAVEAVGGGTGIAIVPMSVARLHQRRDVTYRTVTDLEPTQIGLAWLVDNDDPRVQTFIGIVRGRSERSSRG
jgi:DNA-binding transcriptional LysR family regulator